MASMADLLAELRGIREDAARRADTRPRPEGDARAAAAGLSPEEVEQYNRILDEIQLKLSKNAELITQTNVLREKEAKILEKQSELQTAIQAGDAASIENAKQAVVNAKKAVEEQDKLVESIARAEEAAQNLSDSFASLFSETAPDLKSMLNPNNIQGLADDFKSLANAKMLTQAASNAAVEGLKKYVEETVNLAIKLGDAEIGFMKATGANQEFARSLTNSFAETRTFGASVEETSAAAQGLFTTFTDFTMVSQQTRESLTETATVMGKLGVSNQDFAQSIQTSTKAMGMSAAQASQNMLDLEKFSRDLGVAPSELAGQFAGARDMLAKLGSDGTRAFKDLAIAAKTTGMSIENIVNLTNKFDTFEGAAQQAGQLNAALGGNFVNAMDLMMATNPAERFDMIRDSILDAGLSFDEMSYYQKQFYRDSLGLSDVGELAALMSGDMDLVAGATEESGQSMIDAKKRAQELANFQDRLNMAFAQMIPIITPLIDLFSDLTSFIAENMDIIKPLIGVGIVLASVFGLIIPEAASTAAGVAGLTLGFSILFDSIPGGKDALTGLNLLFTELSNIFGELFDAIGGIFTPLGDLFGLLFDQTGSGAALSILIGLIKHLTYTLGAVVSVITFVVNGIVTLRDLFFDFAFGTNNASESINRLMSSISGLLKPLFHALEAFGLLNSNVEFLGFTLYEKQYASNFLEGIVKIANAFSAMAAGVAETLNPFTAMERVIDSIGNAFTNIISAVSSFFMVITDPTAAENVMKIGEAITAIPTRKNLEFVGSMGSLAAANTAAAALGAVENVTNVITGNTGAGGSPTPYEVTINVMLERDKLATVTKEIVGEMSRDAARQGA